MLLCQTACFLNSQIPHCPFYIQLCAKAVVCESCCARQRVSHPAMFLTRDVNVHTQFYPDCCFVIEDIKNELKWFPFPSAMMTQKLRHTETRANAQWVHVWSESFLCYRRIITGRNIRVIRRNGYPQCIMGYNLCRVPSHDCRWSVKGMCPCMSSTQGRRPNSRLLKTWPGWFSTKWKVRVNEFETCVHSVFCGSLSMMWLGHAFYLCVESESSLLMLNMFTHAGTLF